VGLWWKQESKNGRFNNKRKMKKSFIIFVICQKLKAPLLEGLGRPK
jgi:hypothetical protein